MSKNYVLPERNKRFYLNESFDAHNKNDVKSIINQLISKPPKDFKSAAHWFGLFHEASCAISEAQTHLELALYLDTSNSVADKNLKEFEDNILSPLLMSRSELMDIYMKSPWRNAMHGYDNERIIKDFLTRRKFTNQSVSLLQVEENQLIREYKKFNNSSKAYFQGRTIPISMIVGKLNDEDPTIRKDAFISYWSYVQKNEKTYYDLFDALRKNRIKQSESVGAKNYTELAFSELGRIDYSETECSTFRDSIFLECIPVIQSLALQQKKSLKENSIKPWNVQFFPSLSPKNPPADGSLQNIMLKVYQICQCVHPVFGEIFKDMLDNNLIDIFPRPNKAPGAFCVTFQESGTPFLFGNLSAQFKDAMTLLHEFGHAIHGKAVSQIKNVLLRHPGFEFCELASIGFELLASPFYQILWPKNDDAKKALANQLFTMLQFWPFMAMIDEWQHKVYTSNSDVSIDQLNLYWKQLSQKYRPHVDWSGYEEFEELGWISRPHVFSTPFYYIDYGIAQLGAIQLWSHSKVNYQNTVHNYISSLSLGAQKSLQGLFATAGAKFSFESDLIKNLCHEMTIEIQNVLNIR